jgi:hypothetical protein
MFLGHVLFEILKYCSKIDRHLQIWPPRNIFAYIIYIYIYTYIYILAFVTYMPVVAEMPVILEG